MRASETFEREERELPLRPEQAYSRPGIQQDVCEKASSKHFQRKHGMRMNRPTTQVI
jgi:hypothetical protein